MSDLIRKSLLCLSLMTIFVADLVIEMMLYLIM